MNKKEMVEKIEEMCKLQDKLDKRIYFEHGTNFKFEKTRQALFDELGELNHELKANWCWWKKSQQPLDEDKILGELVDVWHFGLSIFNHTEQNNVDNCLNEFIYMCNMNDLAKKDTVELFQRLLDGCYYKIIYDLLYITYHLDFTLDDVYNEYLNKNKENHERQDRGY